MANIPLKSIKFPDLDDTYTVPSNAGELPYNKSATYPADTVGKALQNIGDSSAPAIIETAQGSIASFDDGADNVPVKDLVAEIVPLQSGSGDPSPSNVRAISGWSGAEVYVSGKNLFDKSSTAYIDGAYFDGGTIDTGGGRRIVYVPCNPNTTYTASRKAVTTTERFYLGYTKELPVVSGSVYGTTSAPSSQTVGNNMSITITTGADAKYLACWAYWGNETTALDTLQIEEGPTATTYEPYSGETHTISFASAGTVYGGRLDVTSGVLTVDHELTQMNPSWGWDVYELPGVVGGKQYYVTSGGVINLPADKRTILCNTFKPIDIADRENYNQSAYLGSAGYSFRYDEISSVNDWKTFLTNNNVYVYHYLVTPQTYQLTPTEVKTLLKNNNVWADTGDVTVEYVADTKTFIENLVNA